ncbi:hypothetical protein FRB99_007517 [Tulasnella sp. 403]|nr:hypothetical protein FRB99_007517 [Tulasnella sp. 403]
MTTTHAEISSPIPRQKTSLERHEESYTREQLLDLSPMRLLKFLESREDTVSLQRFGNYVLRKLIVRGKSDLVHGVYQIMVKRGLSVDHTLRARLVLVLTQDDRLHNAVPILAKLMQHHEYSKDRTVLASALAVAGKMGNVVDAEKYFKSLTELGGKSHDDHITWLLQSYAKKGAIQPMLDRFDECFPPNSERHPTSAHYAVIIHAHSSRGDVAVARSWLSKAAEEGCNLDPPLFNSILSALAKQQDFGGVESLLREMEENAVPRTLVTYNILVAMFARRQDPVSAEQLVRQAIEEGIRLDDKLIHTLIQAHIAAGSWNGVVRVIDFLSRVPDQSPRFSSFVLEALLESYVRIGAPFPVVLRHFRHRLTIWDRKQSYGAYCLLMRSACDTYRFGDAKKFLLELEVKAANPASGFTMDNKPYAVLLAGYLRGSRKKEARELFDSMRQRGISLPVDALAAIVKSYGEKNKRESLEIAERLLNSLIGSGDRDNSWVSTSPKPMQSLFVPAMQAGVELLDAEAVEKQFKILMETGEKLSIEPFTVLLDVHRRLGNLDRARQVWEHIFHLALEEIHNPLVHRIVKATPGSLTSNPLILSQPFSIYIDILSMAGAYDEIVTLWRSVLDAGFAINARNCNAIVLALIRAGQPAGAFRIVEEILFRQHARFRNQLRVLRRRPKSMFLYGDDWDGGDVVVSTPDMRFRSARASKRISIRPEVIDKDPARPLIYMRRRGPYMNYWKPVPATRLALKQVLRHLGDGYVPRPVLGRPNTSSVMHDPEEARRILDGIKVHFPRAVHATLRPVPSSFIQRKRRNINDLFANWQRSRASQRTRRARWWRKQQQAKRRRSRRTHAKLATPSEEFFRQGEDALADRIARRRSGNEGGPG